MLLFSLLGFVLVVIVLMVGASFINLLFVQNQVQKLTDEASLTGAIKLNEGNRVGQMNELVARCRQLVYTSRDITYSVPNTTPDLQMLSQQLLDEDRQSAIELERERSRLQVLCASESKKAISESLDSQVSLYRSLLPWLRMDAPQLVSVEFGSVAKVTSNTCVNPILEGLANHDKSMKYYDAGSGLYLGNIDAKLPGDDSDLTFKISSLAAPVNGTIAPARLTLNDVFEKQKGQQLQSAAKITVGTEVAPSALARQSKPSDITKGANTHKVLVGNEATRDTLAKQSQSLSITSTASTNGAAPIR